MARSTCVVALLVVLSCVCAPLVTAILPVSFNHGVASGDPYSDSLVLWTRVTPRPAAADLGLGLSNNGAINGQSFPPTSATYNVTWTVYTNSNLTGVAKSGSIVATADTDWTVKVLATGLKSAVQYYYTFQVGAVVSPRGTFRLPQPQGVPQATLKYFIFSCSNWGWGYFNAYDTAARYDLDFWVHEGDWFYEYGVATYPDPITAVRYEPSPLGLQPEHEIETIADYRQRHALYRADPALQALSAAAPLIAIWDDHEFFNNIYRDGGENQNVGDNPFALRKLAAAMAYREWIPIRDASMGDIYAINRTFQFGDLATMWMLEDRATARTNAGQNVPANTPGSIPGTEVVGALVAGSDPSTWATNTTIQQGIMAYKNIIDTRRTNANETQLGAAQEAWLAAEVRQSVSSNASTWQLFNEGTIMQDWYLSDFEGAIAARRRTDPTTASYWQEVLTNLTGSAANTTYTQWGPVAHAAANFSKSFPVSAANRAATRGTLAVGRYAINFDADSWQGYLADRNRFLDAIEPARNSIVYTGDSHNFWAGYLYKVDLSEYLNTTRPINITGRTVRAVEFDGGSVTTTGFAESAFQPWPLEMYNAAWLAANPNMFLAEMRYHGGMYVVLNKTNHHLENIYVDTVASKNYTAFCGVAYDVAPITRAGQQLQAVAGTCTPVPNVAPYTNAPATTVAQIVTSDPAVVLFNSRYPITTFASAGAPARAPSSAPTNVSTQTAVTGLSG